MRVPSAAAALYASPVSRRRPQPVRALFASVRVLTALPVGGDAAPRWAVLCLAPVVGLGLGGIAAALLLAARWAFPGLIGRLLASVLVVGALAGMTGGLHLDGLADTADGLGRHGDPQESLAVMRRGDVGPFGVVALVLVVLVDVGALARDTGYGRGIGSVLLAVVCGRLAMLHAGVGIRPARPEGLGASVAGSVPFWWAALASVLALGLALVPAAFGQFAAAGRLGGGLVVGLLAAAWLRRRAVRRFGGITGDVLGALCEVATATALLVTALR